MLTSSNKITYRKTSLSKAHAKLGPIIFPSVSHKAKEVNSKHGLCVCVSGGQVVGVSLIAAAAYGRSFGIVWSLSIISVVMVVGLFLIFVSTLGLVGALRQNQMVLFTVSFRNQPNTL